VEIVDFLELYLYLAYINPIPLYKSTYFVYAHYESLNHLPNVRTICLNFNKRNLIDSMSLTSSVLLVRGYFPKPGLFADFLYLHIIIPAGNFRRLSLHMHHKFHREAIL
jgi:hypothetical protein